MTQTSHSYNALYYPFIHFKDEGWLKTTLLYWDKIGRIVPPSYKTEDSETVKALSKYIKVLQPDWVLPAFGKTFIELVKEHGPRLRQRYGVALRDQFPLRLPEEYPPSPGGPSGTHDNLSYVYYEKMTEELRWLLIDSGIAEHDGKDSRWIGMHPKIARVYMTALADQLAGEQGMVPLTDETIDHLAVGGWTMERLAQALLGDVALVEDRPGAMEYESMVAYAAFQTVLPKDLDNLSVDSIIKFREDNLDEQANFQRYIHNFLDLHGWLSEIRDRAVFEQVLQEQFDKELKPMLKDYREKLRAVGIDTVLGVMGLQVAVPSVLAQGATALGLTLSPVGGLAAGAALAMIHLYRDRRKETRELRSSPVSYLLRMEQDLKPRQLTDWIWRDVNKFLRRG